MTEGLTVIPAKLVPAKAGSGNPVDPLCHSRAGGNPRYFYKFVTMPHPLRTRAFVNTRLMVVGLAALLSLGILYATLIAPSSAYALQGTPQIIAYKGRLTDPSGPLLGGSGTTYYFKFSIWTTSAISSGSRLWPVAAPTSVGLTVTNGVFNVNMGDTAGGFPHVLDLDFNQNRDLYLQVEVSSNNSSFETPSPRQRLTSAPFSLLSSAVSGTTTPSSFGTTSPLTNTALFIEATTTTAIPLTIRASSGQAVNLFNIQNAAGAHLLSVNSSGSFFASSTLNVTGLSSFLGGLLSNNASSTITHLSGIFSTTTQATSTNLSATGRATTTELYVANVLSFLGTATSTFTRAGLSVVGLSSSQGLEVTAGQIIAPQAVLTSATLTQATSTNFAITGFATSSTIYITQSLTYTGTATSTFTRGGLSVSGGGLASDQGLVVSAGKALITQIDITGTGTSTSAGGISSAGLASSQGLVVSAGQIIAPQAVLTSATLTQATSTNFAITGRATTSQLYVTNLLEVQGIATSTFTRGGLSVSGGGLASDQGLVVSAGKALITQIDITGTGTSTAAGGISSAGLSSSQGLVVSTGPTLLQGAGRGLTVTNDASIGGALKVSEI